MEDKNSPARPDPNKREKQRSRRLLIGATVMAAVAAIAITALLVDIFERKQEAKNPFYRVVELNDKYGGSEAIPQTPTDADPRSVVARSKLEQDPRLKTMWAGYSFSIDYRERRGHAYMLDDQTYTGRQKANPPAMCINCHARSSPLT